MRNAVAAVVVILAVALAGSLPPESARSGEMVQRWEYRVLTRDQLVELGKKDLATGLNRLGDEGWELAAVDAGYIFKRPRRLDARQLESLQQHLAAAESDVAVRKDRLAWVERMFKKGFVSDNQVQNERAMLRSAELALERARRELKVLLPPPKEVPTKEKP
jgi:hypothetical protein